MFPLATDWATISSLATAGGTLVLAVATFASVRSANRSARIAEVALQEQRQPVFAPSRLDDPPQKIMFVEGRWVRAEGGRGVAERDGDVIYLAINLRNVGAGIGVCQGWLATGGLRTSAAPRHGDQSEFHTQTRDLYIPAGDVGMWQGALRDPKDPYFAAVAQAIEDREPISVELLYSDQVGEQRTISRFGLMPAKNEIRIATITRHWFLDRPGPRSERDAAVEAAAILRRVQASEEEAAAIDGADADETDGRTPVGRQSARD